MGRVLNYGNSGIMSHNSELYRITKAGQLHKVCREERARLIKEDEQLRRQEGISRHLRWLQGQQQEEMSTNGLHNRNGTK